MLTEVSQQNGRSSFKQAQIGNLTSQVAEYKLAAEAKGRSLKLKQEALDKSEAGKNLLEQKVIRLRSKSDALKEKVAGLQNERSILKRDLLRAGKDFKTTCETIRSDKEENIKKLKGELVALRETKDGLTFDCAAQKARCLNLKEEKTWLMNEHEHLTE